MVSLRTQAPEQARPASSLGVLPPACLPHLLRGFVFSHLLTCLFNTHVFIIYSLGWRPFKPKNPKRKCSQESALRQIIGRQDGSMNGSSRKGLGGTGPRTAKVMEGVGAGWWEGGGGPESWEAPESMTGGKPPRPTWNGQRASSCSYTSSSPLASPWTHFLSLANPFSPARTPHTHTGQGSLAEGHPPPLPSSQAPTLSVAENGSCLFHAIGWSLSFSSVRAGDKEERIKTSPSPPYGILLCKETAGSLSQKICLRNSSGCPPRVFPADFTSGQISLCR